jgi:tetratricopeptide (TPR) repeat protein
MTLLMRLLAVAFLASIGIRVQACVWTYGTSLRGEKISINGLAGEDIVANLRDSSPRTFWEQQRKAREPDMARHPDRYERTNFAVTLLHLGDVKPALAIFTQLERENPGSYITAANLGTAYELTSDDRAALHWIRQAIARNPDAHDGTEWLHARILEAKLALRADPRWLETHNVLGIDFGTAVIPKLPASYPFGNDGKPQTPENVKYALWYQLDERYQFVNAPDFIVGSLLFEWANLLVRTDALESAVALYRESLRYKTPRADLAVRRLQRVEEMLSDAKVRGR